MVYSIYTLVKIKWRFWCKCLNRLKHINSNALVFIFGTVTTFQECNSISTRFIVVFNDVAITLKCKIYQFFNSYVQFIFND
ncbi:hypothetical protein D3C71_1886860 [compost metagenome]